MKVCLYVDDMLCRGNRTETDRFYAAMRQRFVTKEPQYVEPSLSMLTPDNKLGFVGFDISCAVDSETGGLKYNMDQADYVKELLSSYDVRPVKNIGSPMSDMSVIKSGDEPLSAVDADEYRKIVGKLNYLVAATRYDIAYAVSQCSQFNACPTVGAHRALYRVLSYLLATSDLALCGFSATYNTVEYYSDADLGGARPLTTCSHTGSMIMLNGVPVFWQSKRQPSTSISSAQAEIYALSETARQCLRYKYMTDDLVMELPSICKIMTDNMQAVSFSKALCVSSRLGGVFDLRCGWVKELRDEGAVAVEHVPAAANCADFLTKPLPAYLFRRALKLVQLGGGYLGCR